MDLAVGETHEPRPFQLPPSLSAVPGHQLASVSNREINGHHLDVPDFTE
jgi:hypothetical protein